MKPQTILAPALALSLLLAGTALGTHHQPATRAATTYHLYLPDIPVRLTTGLGSVTGVVYDASTRSPLQDAQVCYGGSCDITSSLGAYTLLNIPSGWQKLTASEIGHYAISEELYVLGQVTNKQDFSLPVFSSSGDIYMRIVLNWDATPSWPPLNMPNDMDAHLWLDDSLDTHIYFEKPGECTNYPNACLELDVQEGYGPETVAIRKLENYSYHFGVLNVYAPYEGVPPITQLAATVRVFDSSGLLWEFIVPGEGQGDFWYVFSMSSEGVIQPQNCITGEPGVGQLPACP